MKIVNFTLLLGPTWVQRWTYIGPDWTHVGPAWTYIDYEGTAATGCSKTFDTKMKRKLGSPDYEDLFL